MQRRKNVKTLRDEVEEVRKDLEDVKERLAKFEGIDSQLITRIDDRKSYVVGKISDLDKRIDSLDKRLDYVTKIFWTLTISVIATLIANIVILILTRGVIK